MRWPGNRFCRKSEKPPNGGFRPETFLGLLGESEDQKTSGFLLAPE